MKNKQTVDHGQESLVHSANSPPVFLPGKLHPSNVVKAQIHHRERCVLTDWPGDSNSKGI